MRLSKAMHLLDADVNPIYIRDFLGHESVTTTEIYAHNGQAPRPIAVPSNPPYGISFPTAQTGRRNGQTWLLGCLVATNDLTSRRTIRSPTRHRWSTSHNL